MNTTDGRKPYDPPRILHTEKIETRGGIVCQKADTNCLPGPIQS